MMISIHGKIRDCRLLLSVLCAHPGKSCISSARSIEVVVYVFYGLCCAVVLVLIVVVGKFDAAVQIATNPDNSALPAPIAAATLDLPAPAEAIADVAAPLTAAVKARTVAAALLVVAVALLVVAAALAAVVAAVAALAAVAQAAAAVLLVAAKIHPQQTRRCADRQSCHRCYRWYRRCRSASNQRKRMAMVLDRHHSLLLLLVVLAQVSVPPE